MATIDIGRKEGGGRVVPLSGGAGSLSNTICGLGRGLLPYQVASSSIQPVGHNRHVPKIGGCALFCGGGAWSPSSIMWPAWTEAHLHVKCRLDLSSRLSTIDMCRKLGGGLCPHFWGGELGPHLTQSPELRPICIPSGI